MMEICKIGSVISLPSATTFITILPFIKQMLTSNISTLQMAIFNGLVIWTWLTLSNTVKEMHCRY